MITVEELERRVVVLEKAQVENTTTMTWMVGILGQIQATVTAHTDELKEIRADIRGVKADIRGLRDDMPSIVADALRKD